MATWERSCFYFFVCFMFGTLTDNASDYQKPDIAAVM